MPRKKPIDPVVLMLDFYASEPVESLRIIHRILTRSLVLREPQVLVVPKVRRKRQPTPIAADPGTQVPPDLTKPVADLATPSKRRRRMRADSAPPRSEATPIVPQVSEVGEDEAYTGH